MKHATNMQEIMKQIDTWQLRKDVNCMFKTYNLIISDERDAFNPECPRERCRRKRGELAGRILNSSYRKKKN